MSQEEMARILSEYKDRNDIAAMADKMKMPYSSLARILNEHDAYDLGIKKLVPFIEAAAFDFTLLDHIEARLGRVAVRVNTGELACDYQGLARLAKETGHVIQVVSEALDDGYITRKEASACIKELLDLVQVAMGLIRELRLIEAQ